VLGLSKSGLIPRLVPASFRLSDGFHRRFYCLIRAHFPQLAFFLSFQPVTQIYVVFLSPSLSLFITSYHGFCSESWFPLAIPPMQAESRTIFENFIFHPDDFVYGFPPTVHPFLRPIRIEPRWDQAKQTVTFTLLSPPYLIGSLDEVQIPRGSFDSCVPLLEFPPLPCPFLITVFKLCIELNRVRSVQILPSERRALES